MRLLSEMSDVLRQVVGDTRSEDEGGGHPQQP